MSALEKLLQAAESDQLLLAAADDPDYGTSVMVQAADAALDEACRILRDADLSGCPPDVRQATALVYAASVVVDGLMDQMNLDDPDDSETALSRWVQDTAYNPLSVLLAGVLPGKTSQGAGETYADPGYREGMKRYPVTEGGKASEKRIRAAWAYINMPKNQEGYTAQQVASIKSKIKAAAGKAGVQISGDGDS